jgi:hypothetical protein
LDILMTRPISTGWPSALSVAPSPLRSTSPGAYQIGWPLAGSTRE